MTAEYKTYLPPRDFVAYGEDTPSDCWPNSAKIAVSFVLNYEEGAEHTLWNGDAHSEAFLSESAFHRQPKQGRRDLYVESQFEYGTRAGLPRLLKLFKKFGYSWSTWTNARALEASAYYGKYLVEGGHDIAAHGNRWITQTELYADPSPVASLTGKTGPEEEAAHVAQNIDRLRAATGLQDVPTGYYLGRGSLYSKYLISKVHKEKGVPLVYNSDSYSSDLPYWQESPLAADGDEDEGLLHVPYGLFLNDHRFYCKGAGASCGDDFFDLLKAEFDYILREGREGKPKMMTIAMHSRILGRPGRIQCLKRFMEYVQSHGEEAWVTTRADIARHWQAKYPYKTVGLTRLTHAQTA
ncbi:hypothetical protein JCM10207_002190 [Rhodosporidiobolus poonsookiae]